MDQEAEQAIRDAFTDLAERGMPINRSTVPDAAQKRLGNGRQPERIHAAIEQMIERGALSAPNDPMRPGADWSLIEE